MNSDIVAGLIVGAILLLPTILATVLFEEPITEFLARITGGRLGGRKEAPVARRWISRWNRLDGDATVWHYEHIRIRQFRSSIIGRLQTGGRRMTCKREGRYLTGEWWDPTDRRGRYGAVQLIMRNRGRIMEGKWVGFSDERAYVRHGQWEMVRADRPESEHEPADKAWEMECP